VALRCDYAEGEPAFIVLVEHWSDAYKVCLERTAFYYIGLRLRHLGSEVLPVILVTDERPVVVEERLEGWANGALVLTFQARVVRITPEQIPRLRALQSIVAAVLLARALLIAQRDEVEATAQAVVMMAAVGARAESLRRYLPLAAKMGKLTREQEPLLRRRLREDTTMVNVFDEVWTEAEAKGIISGIRHRMAKGKLTIDEARNEVRELIADGDIPPEVGRQALALLG
jgi:hypothetical protein